MSFSSAFEIEIGALALPGEHIAGAPGQAGKEHQRRRFSSWRVSGWQTTGSMKTLPSGLKRMNCSPPYAAMYWSCLPIGSLSLSISIMQASRAKPIRRHNFALQGIEGVQKSDRKTAGGPHAALARQVGHGNNLQTAGEPHVLHAFPHQGVFNLIDCIDKLGPGVTNAKRISKMLFDRQVDVLVDRGA